MQKGLLGKKLGMTQVFSQDGTLLPVTVVEVTDNVVLQNKTIENDGYNAVQIGFGAVNEKKLTKPAIGFFKKINKKPVRYIREIRLKEPSIYTPGTLLGPDILSIGESVDITGISKGKGFSGGIKRHNFARGPMSHGSKSHREPGSMGPRMSGGGGRVFKGKKLPGQMGFEKVTVQNLTIARIDKPRNLLLIKGAVPGSKGALVLIRRAKKC